jgi:hypothetical protein
MADLTQMTADANGTVNASFGGGGAGDYQDITDAPDGGSSDYAFNTIASNGTEVSSFSLENVDADFSSMTTLSLYYDVQAVLGKAGGDQCDLTAQIYDADTGGNALTNATSIFADETTTTRTQSNTAFSGLTGTKAQWNSAYIRFTFVYNKSKGGNNVDIRLFGFYVDGTYAAGPSFTAVNPVPLVPPSVIALGPTLMAPSLYTDLEWYYAAWQSGDEPLLWTANEGFQSPSYNLRYSQVTKSAGLAYASSDTGANSQLKYGDYNFRSTGDAARSTLIVCSIPSAANNNYTLTGFGGTDGTSLQWDWWHMMSNAASSYRAGITEEDGHLMVSTGSNATLAYFDTAVPTDTDTVLLTTYPSGGDTGDIKAYYDGVEISQTDPQTGGVDTGTNEGLAIGGRQDAIASFSGFIYLVMHWARVLSPDEAKVLALDPFVMFRNQRRREIAMLVAAAAAARRVFVIS